MISVSVSPMKTRISLSLPLFIARRAIRAHQRGFVSFISFASVLGIALGITVLLTVLSVMNGFQKEVRERMLSLTPHVVLMPPVTFNAADWDAIRATMPKAVQAHPMTPLVEGPVMFLANQEMVAGLVKGIDPQTIDNVLPLKSHMVQGQLSTLEPGQYGVILGSGLASTLQASVGSSITLILPEAHVGLAGVLPRLKRLKVVGIFSVEYSYDSSMALMHIEDAARLVHHSITFDAIQVALPDPLQAPMISKKWRSEMPRWRIIDWTSHHQTYFKAVQTEKTMMFLILMLLIAIAAFNLVSMLVMTVKEKTGDIAILRAMGASRGVIMRIFVWQGFLLGTTGIILGVLGGVLLSYHVTEVVAFLESVLHTHFISSDVYFIDFLPSEFHWKDAIGVVITSFIMSLTATLYPAWRAASIWPAEALRDE